MLSIANQIPKNTNVVRSYVNVNVSNTVELERVVRKCHSHIHIPKAESIGEVGANSGGRTPYIYIGPHEKVQSLLLLPQTVKAYKSGIITAVTFA